MHGLQLRLPTRLSGCGARCRMKAAMLSGQEADDEKLSWRVDAEVRLRLEEVRREETARSAALQVTIPPILPACTPGGRSNTHATDDEALLMRMARMAGRLPGRGPDVYTCTWHPQPRGSCEA